MAHEHQSGHNPHIGMDSPTYDHFNLIPAEYQHADLPESLHLPEHGRQKVEMHDPITDDVYAYYAGGGGGGGGGSNTHQHTTNIKTRNDSSGMHSSKSQQPPRRSEHGSGRYVVHKEILNKKDSSSYPSSTV